MKRVIKNVSIVTHHNGISAVALSSWVEFWNRTLTVAVSLSLVVGFAHSSKMTADAYLLLVRHR